MQVVEEYKSQSVESNRMSACNFNKKVWLVLRLSAFSVVSVRRRNTILARLLAALPGTVRHH
jgi:hypothetical protein